ncbi:MAG: EAL domain-containing protein [Leptospiraceae bacterium]|nr:EAL domain-containing protein [Leptospiraceae bacterium]
MENNKFRALFEQAAVGVAEIDSYSGQFITINQKYCDIVGYSEEEMKTLSFQKLTHPDDIQEDLSNMKLLVEGEIREFSMEKRYFHKNGSLVWVKLTVSPLWSLGERPSRHIAVVEDITQKKQAEIALKESEEKYRQLVESTNDWIVEVDKEGKYVYTNPQVETILGYKPYELIGKTFMDLMTKEEAERVYEIFAGTIQELGKFERIENICLHKKGYEIVIETNGSPFFDSDGNLLGYRGINRDITERKKTLKMLDYLAYHDYLTGLPNRLLFNSKLQIAIEEARKKNQKIGILFIDLDKFKNINDTLGHQVGDELLQDISQKLISQIIEKAVLARLGGDEFILYSERVDSLQEINTLAQKILEIFLKPFTINDLELFVTVSIGISLYPEDGEDVHTLIKNADLAMYEAKAQGNNHIKLFEKEMSIRIQERMDLENRLRYAIERNELSIEYQAQINMVNNQLTGMEALLRWNNPRIGYIPPSKFIPIAEEMGFILNIGEWLIRTVCKQIVLWKNSGFTIPRISINISVKQIEQTNLVRIMKHISNEAGISLNCLELEITESVIMSQTEKNIATLDALRNLGLQLSVDDFGTGYSSLKYLKRLPIHKLKIDKSFVSDISKDSNGETIIRAIIALAKSLDLVLIAEGVETVEQANFLIGEGCILAQGFYYSFPLKPDHFFDRWINIKK